MAEQTEYKSRDGQILTLSFEIVRKYLVQGKSELVTNQEIFYFMGVCKSKGLNPFKKDCYLIKYSQDPAAIVVSIDYFRSRARGQNDCKGWKKGIIVLNADGKVKYSNGLLLPGEQLLGGWFEATPDGWNEPFKLEVNLDNYIKKTRDGNITRFWQKENQPTQIAKVAESQGLRTIWPDEFQNLYTDSEISPDSMPAYIPEKSEDESGTFQDVDIDAKFNEMLPEDIDEQILYAFIHKCVAVTNKQSTEEAITARDVKADAIANMEYFLKAFEKFEKEFKAEQKKEKEKESKPRQTRKSSSKVVEMKQKEEPSNGDVFSKLKADKNLFPDTYRTEAQRLNLPLDPAELTLKNAEALHAAINAKTDSQDQAEY